MILWRTLKRAKKELAKEFLDLYERADENTKKSIDCILTGFRIAIDYNLMAGAGQKSA